MNDDDHLCKSQIKFLRYKTHELRWLNCSLNFSIKLKIALI